MNDHWSRFSSKFTMHEWNNGCVAVTLTSHQRVYLLMPIINANLKQIRRLLVQDVTATLVLAFVLNKLDYCNAVLAALSKFTIASLQTCTLSGSETVFRLTPHDYVPVALHDIHWLPVCYRITYKLCLLVHLLRSYHAPRYLAAIPLYTPPLSLHG